MKKKLKNYLKTGILFLGISLLFTNCENEELDTLQETESIEDQSQFPINIFQENFTLEQYDDPSQEINNISVDWKDYTTNKIENL